MHDIDELVDGCKAGKRRFQQQLYELYAPKLLAMLMRYAYDRPEAEDFLQDGFIRIFTNIKNLKNNRTIESWMRRIMVNTALEHIRRKRKMILGLEVNDSMNISADDNVLDEMSANEILALIRQLPTGYRVVFNLYAIEGYTHREIALELDISEGTSKSQYARARKQLQKMVMDSGLVKRKIS